MQRYDAGLGKGHNRCAKLASNMLLVWMNDVGSLAHAQTMTQRSC